MNRPPRRHRARFVATVAAVAAACVVGLAPFPAGGLAGAARSGPRLSVAACFSTKGRLGWVLSLPQSSLGVGQTAFLDVTLTCTGGSGSLPSTPVAGVPVTVTVSPPDLASLLTRARTTTNAFGTVLVSLLGERAGRAHVLVEVADGGVCARDFSATACRTTVTLVVSANGGVGVSTSKKAPPDADGILPPRHPAHNAAFLVQVPPLGPCGPTGKGPAHLYNASLACAQFYVAHINAARRLQGEHITAMRLPTNWARLTPVEQLFVTADLERVDRNLPPYVGLSRTLNAVAEVGAAHAEDPEPLSPGLIRAAGSNEFPGVVSAAEADYGWMYTDGVGGNLDCKAATDPGCWGHRDDILGRDTGLGCTDCVMGAGIAYPSGDSPDLTELFVEPLRPGQFAPYFTWTKDVVPYLKG